MSQSDHSIEFNQDESSTDLLHAWLERLFVSERESLFRVLEQTDLANDFDESPMSFHAAREEMRIYLMDEVNRLPSRQAFVFRRWAQGAAISEIASEMNESLLVVSRELRVLQKRMIARLAKEQIYQSGTKVTPTALRLEAFDQLRRRLGLTSAKAAEWQNSVHEARR